MEEPDAMTRTSWFCERPMLLRMGLLDLYILLKCTYVIRVITVIRYNGMSVDYTYREENIHEWCDQSDK